MTKWSLNIFMMNQKKSFKDYAKNESVNNLYIHSIDGKSVCNYFIKYENLTEDIIKIM